MTKAIIVEDEINSLNNLKNLLNQHCEDIEIVGDADSLQAASALMQRLDEAPDVAFLDISLPDGVIFDWLNELEGIEFETIFVTAYDNYAVQAFEYSSLGYVLKPIHPDKLKGAVERVTSRKAKFMNERMAVFNDHYNQKNAFHKMTISALDGIYFISIDDIVRFEAEDNYTHIYMKDGQRITASKTIKSYEDLLKPFNFYRVHKRHVINLNFVKKFVRGDGGYLIMEDTKQIEVSRRRRPGFMEKIRSLQRGF